MSTTVRRWDRIIIRPANDNDISETTIWVSYD